MTDALHVNDTSRLVLRGVCLTLSSAARAKGGHA